MSGSPWGCCPVCGKYIGLYYMFLPAEYREITVVKSLFETVIFFFTVRFPIWVIWGLCSINSENSMAKGEIAHTQSISFYYNVYNSIQLSYFHLQRDFRIFVYMFSKPSAAHLLYKSKCFLKIWVLLCQIIEVTMVDLYSFWTVISCMFREIVMVYTSVFGFG